MNRGFFVAGTDTAVGKTFVAVALVRGLISQGLRVAAMKPVASGSERTPHGLRNGDACALAAAANVAAPYARLNPFCFEPAIAPHIAAEEAGIVIKSEVICREYALLAADSDCVVVEGAGGWLAPIGPQGTMADIAAALGLPVVLVVALRLGCLNHALLTARAVEATGLRLAHWIGNATDPQFARAAANVATLSAALGPPLALLPFTSATQQDSVSVVVSL